MCFNGHHHENEKKPTEWKKIFINQISDIGLLSRIHKNLLQLNNKKNCFKIVLKFGQRIWLEISQREIHQ